MKPGALFRALSGRFPGGREYSAFQRTGSDGGLAGTDQGNLRQSLAYLRSVYGQTR